MDEHLLETIGLIVVLGIGAQWIAWRLKLPSILLLLLAGFLAGPVFGWVRPDELLGGALMPVVSISVGLILFEGGLTLKFSELKQISRVVTYLITLGAAVTWVLGSLAAHWVLGWGWSLSILLGAILVVTGPTVIMPLLRHVQPVKRVGSILKWEGILIDPVGALLAVLVFEAILQPHDAPTHAFLGFGKTILIGGVIGVAGAAIIIIFLKRYWVPDFLQNPFSLMIVISSFVASNSMQHESGLLAVTLMGIILANQKKISIRHIVEFKENLRVLLISFLFIVLSARLTLGELETLSLGKAISFLVVMLLLVRPVSVFLSTLRSPLTTKERVFLSWMAPRGIVAAAIASLFALRLEGAGYEQARELVPLTFFFIVGTVSIYGLTASPVARKLNLSQPNPQGVLIAGSHRLARAIGKALKKEGFSVLLVDTNRENIATARLDGIPTFHGSILAEHVGEQLDLQGIGRLLALTPNREINALAALHFREYFGREGVYQLAPPRQDNVADKPVSQELKGRILFSKEIGYQELINRFDAGAMIKSTNLSEEFDFKSFKEKYDGDAVPLFVVTESEHLKIFTAEQPPEPKPGQTIISLVKQAEKVEAPQ